VTDSKQKRERDARHYSEICRHCGYLRINVRHNVDPADQTEGPDYYAAMRYQLHEFVPSGRFEP
jgi:hypothetical protein